MAKVTDGLGRPHSGQVQFAVVGLVVDNVDPDELGRIKVKFPTLHQEPVSFWLRQISPNAGKERGLYALPEVEDEVLVAFMQGSHDTGVIIGQFWNGVDKPPTEAKDGLPGPGKTEVSNTTFSTDTFTDGSKDLASNDRRFWRSRSGHLMVFDDTGGAETVQIWDKDHKMAFVFDSTESRILLTNNDGDLHIRTKNDLYIEAGNDIKWRAHNNIEGESGNDTKHVVKNNWTVETTSNSKLKTGANFDIEAGSNLTVKGQMNTKIEGGVAFEAKGGATAKLSGGAMTEVTGGMVKIN